VAASDLDRLAAVCRTAVSELALSVGSPTPSILRLIYATGVLAARRKGGEPMFTGDCHRSRGIA
jgi:hypothetical protein